MFVFGCRKITIVGILCLLLQGIFFAGTASAYEVYALVSYSPEIIERNIRMRAPALAAQRMQQRILSVAKTPDYGEACAAALMFRGRPEYGIYLPSIHRNLVTGALVYNPHNRREILPSEEELLNGDHPTSMIITTDGAEFDENGTLTRGRIVGNPLINDPVGVLKISDLSWQQKNTNLQAFANQALRGINLAETEPYLGMWVLDTNLHEYLYNNTSFRRALYTDTVRRKILQAEWEVEN